MIFRRIYVLVLGLFSVLLMFSCSGRSQAGICVSLPPQAYIVQELTKNCDIPITVMIPPGSAPTTYAPLPSQIKSLYEAKVYFRIGHPAFVFEKKHIGTYINGNKNISVVSMADSLDLLPDDPHIWLSPSIVKLSVKRLYPVLIQAFPDCKSIIRENYLHMNSSLDSLDLQIREILRPYKGRAFLSYHPAWAYFAQEYSLTQLPVQKEGKAVSAKEMSDILHLCSQKNISIITVQKEYASRQIDVIAQEAQLNTLILDPLSRNWYDNLLKTAQKFADVFHDKK